MCFLLLNEKAQLDVRLNDLFDGKTFCPKLFRGLLCSNRIEYRVDILGIQRLAIKCKLFQ